MLCDPPCQTCVGTATNCTSCVMGKNMYLNTCIDVCPNTHAIVINSVCTQCSSIIADCQTCTPLR